MLDVFLCHAPADVEAAERIQARLTRGAEARVWLEPCGAGTGQTMAAAWDGGMSSAAIVLLLSRNSVPEKLRLEQWKPLLEHVGGNARPGVGAVLLDPCSYPPLLERKRFFRWSDGDREVLRRMEEWVLRQYEDGPATFVPARLPYFAGRESELAKLWESLVDGAGLLVVSNEAPGSGKTALAQEFARTAGSHFRDTMWIACGDRPAESIAWELRNFPQHHRVLLVLDDVTGQLPVELAPDARASVLVTTRRRELALPENARMLAIDSCGAAQRGGALPDKEEQRLRRAMQACRPQDIPLALARWIAGMEEGEARRAAERMTARGIIDPVDVAGTRFRMPAAAPEAADRERHAAVLYGVMAEWRTQLEAARHVAAEIEPALEWAVGADWHLATRLAAHACAFLKAEDRTAEAARIYARLREPAEERNDQEVAENCTWELSWLRHEQGGVGAARATGDQLAFAFV